MTRGKLYFSVPIETDSTARENAKRLQHFYDAAERDKRHFPGATIEVPAGEYEFDEEFQVDNDYIDIVSETGKCDVVFTGEPINVTANNVRLIGLDMGDKPFKIASDLDELICENCSGGDGSFGSSLSDRIVVNGTFTNCSASDYSFGYSENGEVIAKGTFKDCSAGDCSFGYSEKAAALATGTFKDCSSVNYSFGFSLYSDAEASGTFKDCSAGSGSFGSSRFGGAYVSGNFTNCIAGRYSFGFSMRIIAVADGFFSVCSAGDDSFGSSRRGTANVSGHFKDCLAGMCSFGSSEHGNVFATGQFENCSASQSSFCSAYFGDAISSASFLNCSAGDFSFVYSAEGKSNEFVLSSTDIKNAIFDDHRENVLNSESVQRSVKRKEQLMSEKRELAARWIYNDLVNVIRRDRDLTNDEMRQVLYDVLDTLRKRGGGEKMTKSDEESSEKVTWTWTLPEHRTQFMIHTKCLDLYSCLDQIDNLCRSQLKYGAQFKDMEQLCERIREEISESGFRELEA